MEDDKSNEPITIAEENQDSTLNKEPQKNVTTNATSNNNSTEDSDKLKNAWEKWWVAFINHDKSINGGDDNKKKQIDAQINFMDLYKEEKQSRENLANTSQKKDPTSNNNPVGGKSRKNKGKGKGKTKRNTKRKFRNVSSK